LRAKDSGRADFVYDTNGRTTQSTPSEQQRQPACDHQQVLSRAIAFECTAPRMHAEAIALHEDHQLGVCRIEAEALPCHHDLELTRGRGQTTVAKDLEEQRFEVTLGGRQRRVAIDE
jgi:hypothetical protein